MNFSTTKWGYSWKGAPGTRQAFPDPVMCGWIFLVLKLTFFLCVLSVNLAFFTCLNTVWYLVQLSLKVPFYVIFIAPRVFSLCPPLLLLTSVPLPLLPLPQYHHYSIIILQMIKYICVGLSSRWQPSVSLLSKDLYFVISFDLMPVIHYFKFVLFATDITVWQDRLYCLNSLKMSCQALSVGLN